MFACSKPFLWYTICIDGGGGPNVSVYLVLCTAATKSCQTFQFLIRSRPDLTLRQGKQCRSARRMCKWVDCFENSVSSCEALELGGFPMTHCTGSHCCYPGSVLAQPLDCCRKALTVVAAHLPSSTSRHPTVSCKAIVFTTTTTINVEGQSLMPVVRHGRHSTIFFFKLICLIHWKWQMITFYHNIWSIQIPSK